MIGVIERLIPERGFGVIHAEDGTEYVFDFTQVRDIDVHDLRMGRFVSFEEPGTDRKSRGSFNRPIALESIG
jgi:cold shock CspA family protein